jgi:hypothetical protein
MVADPKNARERAVFSCHLGGAQRTNLRTFLINTGKENARDSVLNLTRILSYRLTAYNTLPDALPNIWPGGNKRRGPNSWTRGSTAWRTPDGSAVSGTLWSK